MILYMTGEGPVSPPVPDGVPAPSSPLSTITTPVQVTIGGKPAQVTYQGLAPGLVGSAQLNVIVPAGLYAGRSARIYHDEWDIQQHRSDHRTVEDERKTLQCKREEDRNT